MLRTRGQSGVCHRTRSKPSAAGLQAAERRHETRCNSFIWLYKLEARFGWRARGWLGRLLSLRPSIELASSCFPLHPPAHLLKELTRRPFKLQDASDASGCDGAGHCGSCGASEVRVCARWRRLGAAERWDCFLKCRGKRDFIKQASSSLLST